MITHKICKACGENLEVSKFTKTKYVKGGYENKCKECRKKAIKRYTIKCETCGKYFETVTKKSRFCSSECTGIARQNRIETKCSFCNKNLEVIKSKFEKYENHYCNKDCKAEHLKILMLGKNNHNYNRIKHICDGCGKVIYVIQSKAKDQKYIFCSNECYKKNIGEFFKGENNPCYKHEITKSCSSCGKLITRKPGQFKRDIQFCSSKCRAKYLGNLKIKKIEVICDYCGKKFERQPSQFNGKHHKFCSIECKHKGDSKYFSGENSHAYNHDKPIEDRLIERKYVDYYEWRKKVYVRDSYTCQCCGDNKGGNLVAHHILNYSEHKELRTDINNGITLCKVCHKEFHDIYGYKNNTEEQLKEFLYTEN